MDAADSLAFVDLETTGGNPAFHRITEIGIVRVVGGEVIEEWSSLVNPQCAIPAYIQSFTGISDAMVADAPLFTDLAAAVLEKLRGAVFVAHNARFDYSFLRSEFLRCDTHFSAEVLCTVKLSRRLFPEHPRHNLDAVMQRHGLACDARHRALGDAQVLRDLWFKLQREIPAATLQAATAQAILTVPKLPAHLPQQLADELPEGPGAYRYFGAGDVLLYVGRSHSLRGRVLSQLAAPRPTSRDRKLSDQTRRVEWVATAGDLGAMLLETRWIKVQRPVFNRHPHSAANAATLRPAADWSGRVPTLRLDELESADLQQCFGVFHSEKDARKALSEIAQAQQLCLKLLGFESGPGSCLGFQLGRCRGACVGKEPMILHNTRTQLALSALKIKSWPFPGRIAVHERHSSGFAADGSRDADVHVLENWCYLGTARSEYELRALSAAPAPTGFDVDAYRILVRYFSTHPQLQWRELRETTLHP